MSLPVQSDIVTMDYPSRGGPALFVPAKNGIATQTMDYPARGLPNITNDGFTSVITSSFIGFLGVGIIPFAR